MHDSVDRGTIPRLLLPRGGPPRRRGGGAVGALRGGEEAPARGRRRRGHGCLRRRVGRRRGGVAGQVIEGEQRGRRRRGGGLGLAAHGRRGHAEGRGYRGREVPQERRLVPPVVRPGGAHRGGEEQEERNPSDATDCQTVALGLSNQKKKNTTRAKV
uniref:Uncharacterized protein n=1 Tax=Triticum urartu TaxID=4572 RepID=A0A8R7TSR5_TRIUA